MLRSAQAAISTLLKNNQPCHSVRKLILTRMADVPKCVPTVLPHLGKEKASAGREPKRALALVVV